MAEMILSFESFRAEPIPVPAPWRAWLLPLPSFPIPAPTPSHDGLTPYRQLVERLRHTFITDLRLEHNVLVQAWKLSGTAAAEAMQVHQETWPFDFALGIWPDRLPPQGWNENSMQDAAAAVFRKEEPALPSHRLLHLAGSPQIRLEGARQMLGSGAQIEVFSKAPFSEIAEAGTRVLLPLIADRRFRKFDLYLPLLDRKTLTSSAIAPHLDKWLCNVDIYLRESAEDNGLLVLARNTALHQP